MSDEQAVTQDVGGAEQGGQSGTYTPPATQADLDRIIAERLSRERAKYADYDEMKTKAAEFDKATEATKSEIQKAVERAELAEAKAAAFEKREQVAAWAKDIVKDSPIPADALRGDTEDELKVHFEQLKALIPAEAPKKGAVGPYIPSEGQQPTGPTDPAHAFAAAFEGRI